MNKNKKSFRKTEKICEKSGTFKQNKDFFGTKFRLWSHLVPLHLNRIFGTPPPFHSENVVMWYFIL